MGFKMHTIVLSIVLAFTGTAVSQSITTQTHTVSVSLGAAAQFQCQASNLSPQQQVAWKFIDHNTTIAVGSLIHDGDMFTSKYEIIQPQDSSSIWKLQINDVSATDAGSYKCYVTGLESSVYMVIHLNVLDAPSPPPALEINVTDCCKENGVEDCALPMCRSDANLLTLVEILNNDTCLENNLVKVLTCGQDGRNHLGCCIRTGMPDVCTNLCNTWGPTDADYSPCIIYSSDIVSCFREGQASLPSQPTSVSAVATDSAIIVSWEPPLKNYDLVKHYKVQYRLKNSTDEFKFIVADGSRTFEIIGDLQPYSLYEMRVIAVAELGASQPSYSVDIAPIGPMDSMKTFQNIGECCRNNSVSADCLLHCNTAALFNPITTVDQVLKCYSEVDTIMGCMMGHGDHSPCCRRMNIPDVCLPMCSGKFLTSWNLTDCMRFASIIGACVEEGAEFIPNPPVDTHVVDGSVTWDSAEIDWDEPSGFSAGDYYTVAWKQDSKTSNNWTAVNVHGTEYMITGLQPATVYDIVVTTVNDKGSSLPELTLVLVTEGLPGEWKPFNETECCESYGVPPSCISICSHEARVTDVITEVAIACYTHLTAMLWCATDNRDHRPCCEREGISGRCLDLCNIRTGDEIDAERFLVCISYKNTLSKCFNIGKDVLPLPPEEFAVKRQMETSIDLDWQAPGGQNITMYQVEYGPRSWDLTHTVNTTHTFLSVQKLQPDTLYYFRAYSVNDAGTSLSSDVVKAYTLPIFEDNTTPDWDQLWHNRTDCCTSNFGNSMCTQTCVAGSVSDVSCIDDIDKMLACSADGRNHTDCCQKLPLFPDSCLPLCAGQTLPRNFIAALCSNWYSAVLTCFTEGQGILPSNPQNVRVTGSTATSITLAWELPTNNCDTNSCRYNAMLWENDDIDKLTVNMTTRLNFTFLNLKPVSVYRLAVVAINSNGQSLASPYILHWTRSDTSGTVSISQSPPNVVNKGSDVELHCASSSLNTRSINWIRNRHTVSFRSSLRLSSVTDEDGGLYVCKVLYDDSTTVKKEWNLNIKYQPKAKTITINPVLPGLHQDAKITCIYYGFPDIIHWTKNSEALQDSNKFTIQFLTVDLESGLTTSMLTIYDVVTKDYGNYSCTATNSFGSRTITAEFKNDFPGPTLPPPSSNHAEFYEECCRNHSVPEDCVGAICNFGADLPNVVTNASLNHCLYHFDSYLTCGTDGKDHTKCCTEDGLPELCLPFCAGRVLDYNDSAEFLTCLSHTEQILSCVIIGMQYIPTAPQNVKVAVVDDSILVSWSIPLKNAALVEHYDVYYQSTGEADFEATGPHATHLKLPDNKIKAGDTYTIWVVAENSYGRSHESGRTSISATGFHPPAPKNLKSTKVTTSTIDLLWSKPNTYLSVDGYNVYYEGPKDNHFKMMKVVGSTSTQLKKLQADTSYTIHVTAYNSDGEGRTSNQITVKTEPVKVVTDKQTGSGGDEKGGIIVGIVLSVLFVVVIAVVGFLFYRRVVSKRNFTPKETVSFENPQYGQNPRVSGLPGESSDTNNQFGYGQLREETDNGHAYLSITPQQTTLTDSSAKQEQEGVDNPAMLKLDDT